MQERSETIFKHRKDDTFEFLFFEANGGEANAQKTNYIFCRNCIAPKITLLKYGTGGSHITQAYICVAI
jgi:hypothetical protein